MKIISLPGDVLAKARKAATPEELITIALEYGLTLTEEEAKEHFDRLHVPHEMSAEEIENVRGGYGGHEANIHACGDVTCPKQRVMYNGSSQGTPYYRTSPSPITDFGCRQCDFSRPDSGFGVVCDYPRPRGMSDDEFSRYYKEFLQNR